MKELSVIIPTLNNTNGLKNLVRYFKDSNFGLVVVDNKPDHDKKNLLRLTKFKTKPFYLPQNKNLGFAAAVNLGARYVSSKWLVIMNDDIEFITSKAVRGADVLEKLLKEAKKRKLDALSPVLRNPGGRIENYGYRVLPYGKIELIKNPESKIQSPGLDGLTAACLLIRTEVFKKLKGFDESFFAYLEDVDFFIRFGKAGFKMGLSDSEVLHNHMTTSKTMGNFKARQDMINWWRIYFKNKDFFKMDLRFMIERLKNVSGYIKATLGLN